MGYLPGDHFAAGNYFKVHGKITHREDMFSNQLLWVVHSSQEDASSNKVHSTIDGFSGIEFHVAVLTEWCWL